jgi:tetratricopeptide (TPR) repeat protein
MESGAPVVRQSSVLVALPSLIVLSAIITLGVYFGGLHGLVLSSACYLAYSWTSRLVIARDHRAGMALMRRDLFQDALPHFERSFEFFSKHKWLDEWRGLFLLSSSRMAYREMALINMAYCYGQIGQGEKAIETYQRCLDLFPNSGMALYSLRMLQSVRKS